jgi:dolichol kinase
MKKAIAAFILGLACLFLFSITYGIKVFSAWERRLQAENRLEKENNPGLRGMMEYESRGKKIRLSMNSFDLANGLTFQEQEDLLLKPGFRFSAFLFLVASIWMVMVLRKPGRHQL